MTDRLCCTSRLLGAIAAVMLLGAARPAPAAIHEVTLSGTTFTPSTLTIDPGDTVRWTWVSGLHNVESGVNGTHDGNFRSGDPTLVAGTTFEVTFDQAFLDAHPMPDDQYPYFCVVHATFGMTGLIDVQPPCIGDTDGSGAVDVDDLTAVILDWGTDGAMFNGDVDGSGLVDVDDLTAVILGWGDCS